MATVETQDLLPVRSRVSWSAIAAGAVVALASLVVLGALGAALGLSVTGTVENRNLGIGAAVWAVISLLVALFIGGCVASQSTVGETKTEALTYGVIVWGVVVAMLLWLTASGMRMGFSAVMNVASSPAAAAVLRMSEEDLRNLGFSQEEITRMRTRWNEMRSRGEPAAEARGVAEDPRTTAAAWWTFAGILLSLLAAVGGAIAGAGPSFTIRGFRLRAAAIGTTFPAQGTVPR